MDYVIELTSFGVSLRFNPILQILTSIKFSRMDEVVLQFPLGSSGQVTSFSMPNKIATVGDVYHTFGPTTPGQFEDNYKHFVLEYPGLAFVFKVPDDKSQLYMRDASAVPRPSPEDQSPNLNLPLVELYCRPSDKEAQISNKEDALRDLEKRPYVDVSLGESITFGYPASNTSTTLVFGVHVQEVITALGLPDQRYTKPATAFSSGRNASTALSTVLSEPDYFFNYFELGIDILFDGKLHVAKKFVLWTNLPSQPDFVRYSKCHFRIETRGDPSRNLSASGSLVPEPITPQMKWPDIAAIMGEPTGDPYWFPTREGAFGGMTYYAYPNIIFEVMKKDAYVSKVFLFPN